MTQSAAPTSSVGDRIRRASIGCVLGGAVVIAFAIVAVLVVASVPDRLGLLLSVVAASVPALVYAGLVLRLDRYEVEPVRLIVASFAWGAVGAILFAIVFELVLHGALSAALEPAYANLAAFVVIPPLVEESCKGIAIVAILLLARHEIDSTLDGLIYGAMIGVGFAMTENMVYFGQAYSEEGITGLAPLVLVRAVLGGLGHPAYTAMTGAAIGWARGRHGQGITRWFVPLLGWSVAVVLHTAWNGGALIVVGVAGRQLGLIELGAILTVAVLVPATLVLMVIARKSAAHEMQILRDELPTEVALGTITPTEYRTIISDDLRRTALSVARSRGGRALRGQQLAFFRTAAELAFRSHHLQRGERPRSNAAVLAEDARQRLESLRRALDGGRQAP